MGAAMADALAQLRALLSEVEDKQAGGVWVFDSANLGGTIDQTIRQARDTISFLDGELRERISSPDEFQEGVTGAAAWDAWRDIADQLGRQLALALGTLSRWSAGETLKRVGYDLKAAAQAVISATPFVAIAFAALVVLYLFTIGGGRR